MESTSKIKHYAVPIITSTLLTSVASSSAHNYHHKGYGTGIDDWIKQSKRFTASEKRNMNTGYVYGQQPLIHTFETQASCMRRCTLSCVVQNVEDLMMPRWICPSQQSSELISQTSSEKSINYLEAFDNQLLLLLIPLILILLIAIIIFWMRKTSHNDDEIV